MRTMLESALWLESQGCSVIPLGIKSKTPFAPLLPYTRVLEKGSPAMKRSWVEFQKRRATADEIRGWFEEYGDKINIGLVCGEISGVVCVDVDGPEGHKWFNENVKPFPNLFQYTSSKDKFHCFYRHPGNGVRVKTSVKDFHSELDIRGDGGYCAFSPSVHPSGAIYDLHELEGFTGMDSLKQLPEIFLEQNETSKIAVPVLANIQKEGGKILEGQRDNFITAKAGELFGRGMSYEDVRISIHAINLSECEPPLSEKDVDKCINSIHSTHARNNPMAFNAGGLLNWIANSKGTFTVNDIFTQLGVKMASDKAQVNATLKDLVSQGVIERYGNSTSTYQRVENNFQKIDLSESTGEEIAIKFPLSLTRDCRIYRKNVIVIAGETNSGKTGFLFNICWMNRRNLKFRYITSEMTADEINSRISSFGMTREEWEKFCTFGKCTNNYHNAIDPDGINIIDFMEVYDEFYKIGEKVKQVFDKLKSGIAIIALQKKTGAEYGRGGEMSLEKARLAITLSTHGHFDEGIFGRAEIVKCKNFIGGHNPERKQVFYQLKHGYYYDTIPPKNFPEFDTRLRYWSEKERDTHIEIIKRYCRQLCDKQLADEPLVDAYGNVVGG